MHIKNIHCMIEKLSEVAKCELDKGIENVDTKEMGEVAEIIKELSEAEYYAKISKAMDEAEYGEDYDYRGAYDEYERKGYIGRMRDSKGRYMKRSYTPNTMMHDDEWEDMQRNRDMDRNLGKMYYTEPTEMNNGQSHSESRYDRARRGYEETKSMHKDNSSESKQMKMKSLEDYTKELASDITDMVQDMSAEEKNLLRAKLQTLAQKVS